MASMKTLDWITLTLTTVGAINWGLVLFSFNLVTWLFMDVLPFPGMVKVVYAAVGLSGLYSLWFMVRELM